MSKSPNRSVNFCENISFGSLASSLRARRKFLFTQSCISLGNANSRRNFLVFELGPKLVTHNVASNGTIVLVVGFFFFRQTLTFQLAIFDWIFKISFKRYCCPELKFEKIFYLWYLFRKVPWTLKAVGTFKVSPWYEQSCWFCLWFASNCETSVSHRIAAYPICIAMVASYPFWFPMVAKWVLGLRSELVRLPWNLESDYF